MRGVWSSVLVLVALWDVSSASAAQAPAGVVSRPLAVRDYADSQRVIHAEPELGTIPRDVSPRVRSVAPLVSAVIPGAGQALLGNQRAIAYVALEALSWWNYAKASKDQANQEATSKTLARRVGRAHFTTGSPDALPDAPWAYYEHMRDFLESGQYSLSTTDLVPETDITTYNGFRWQLALSTHTTRAAALEQYKSEAIKPEYEWSWRNAQLQYDLFTRTTFKRNDAAGAGTRALLVIGANHVLSMVDAFTTLRLRARAEADGRTSVGASLRW